MLPAANTTTSMPKGFNSARYTAAKTSIAALDAPEGPLKGSGRLAVQVLICTMRPRATRRAGSSAFMTDKAPNTLTSNSCRTASSGKTSNGPGVRMPALLMRTSRPPPPSASDTPAAQALTACDRLLDVEDLETFIEVADAGGVSAAARRLG